MAVPKEDIKTFIDIQRPGDYAGGASGAGPIRRMTRGSFLGAAAASEPVAEVSVADVGRPPLSDASAATTEVVTSDCF
jgi:hypothetical protein